MIVYVVGAKHDELNYMYPIKAVNTLSNAKEACVESFKKYCLKTFSSPIEDIDLHMSFNMIDEWLIELKSDKLCYCKEYIIRALDVE